MANFSSNEVRQLYVVTGFDDVNEPLDPNDPIVIDGYLRLRHSSADDSVWFEYKSPNGGVAGTGGIVRTDIIEKGKLTYAKDIVNPAQKPFPLKKIVLDPSLNGGAPIVGQKYIFRVRFYGLGVGNNDIQYSKSSGVYTCRPGDTATDVFQKLVELFNLGMRNEPEQWVIAQVRDLTGAPGTTPALNNASIVVEAANTGAVPGGTPGPNNESLRPYVRGRKTGEPMRFELNVSTVSFTNQDFPWGICKDITSTNLNTYTNARVVSDMEYFYLGERTVQDRAWSYPHSFDMVYLSKPLADKNYNFSELGFFYSGPAEDVQRSKKQLTFVGIDLPEIAGEVLSYHDVVA